MSEIQIRPILKPSNSESYGSLDTENQSDGAPDQLQATAKFGQTEYTEKNVEELDSDSHVDMQEQNLMSDSLETNIERKHSQTQFCVVL